MSEARIVCVGEGMLEVSGVLNGTARFSYGGDALNTAIYLARLGWKPGFVSALGADALSADLRRAWVQEGIGTDLTLTHPTRQPGLYAVRTTANGERSFQYWRSDSAARDMFALPEIEGALEEASRCDLLYLSGITLSLYGDEQRARLIGVARDVRRCGGRVAFDPNYRPGLWPSVAAAREAFDSIARYVTIALPTQDDERGLHDGASVEQTIARWRDAGVQEVVVKLGADGARVVVSEQSVHVAQTQRPRAIDTTGAGDSFNAAYLDARLRGADPVDSARAGHALAAIVVTHPGAIIPKDAMPGGAP